MDWKQIVTSVVIAVIVGMSSAYLTVNTTLAVFEERIDRLEKDSADMAKDEKNNAERLIRVETKLDILLKR